MTSGELRKKYLEFFQSKGHKVIPSASLVPENDPSVLFTTAGMHPLVPFLLGEKHPAGNKLVDVQKCIRTGDIDEVGDDVHLTFFEMLGNWSLGDYFKNEAIRWSYEFLTAEKWLRLSPEKLAFTCFAGNENAPRDDESFEVWLSLGISKDRIAFLGAEDNWWPAGAKSAGPQGPDTEMFYWTGENPAPKIFDPKDKRWVEIWNDVFMQYNRTADGRLEKLEKPNVDTGMGVERTLVALNGQKNVFETDVFDGLLKNNDRESRIVADHIKAAVFILSEGIVPGNTGQGYVLRRLIRRAVRYGKDANLTELAEKTIEIYKDVYPELLKNKEKILSELENEKEKFEKTLAQGLKEFEKGTDPFILFSSFGFPLELTKELATEKGVEIDEEKFNEELKKHQELSRTASSGMFKGGLSDAGEETKRLHTATHLLRRALEIVLDQPIMQKGSNITPERLRFDFTFDRKMTDEEKKKVEDLVNQKISEKLPVNRVVLKKEEAEKTGAAHMFGDKYGDEVSIYYVGDSIENAWSKEFCGGPHVTNTSELASIGHPERAESESKGPFKILKEEAVSAGVRRIKAVLE